ncbi:MAG: transposase [Thermoplasmata archaeon]
MKNNEDELQHFSEMYISGSPEIALKMSTTGKYVARLLRDMGFSVHIADPVKIALIFNTSKKNDGEDSYKLAKLLRLNKLPEVHLPSIESYELSYLVRYRKSIGEEITVIKNRVHALIARYGITIDASDIFGRSGVMDMERSS